MIMVLVSAPRDNRQDIAEEVCPSLLANIHVTTDFNFLLTLSDHCIIIVLLLFNHCVIIVFSLYYRCI